MAFLDDTPRQNNIQSGGFNNRLSAVDPIIQAAQIQADSLNQGIPFFEPFQQAGTQGLDFLQGAATPEGLDQLLAQIFGGEQFGALRAEKGRGVSGSLAAGGLTRSGQGVSELSNVGTDLGLQILQSLTGQNQNLADQGLSASFSIADLLSRSAEATASGILGVEERRANRSANRSNNTTDLLGAAIGGLFSDPSLKENIKKIGKVGPLDLCIWDWKKGFEDTIVFDSPRIGFMSTDVREHYPEYVGEFGGYDVIDYKGLIKRLQ